MFKDSKKKFSVCYRTLKPDESYQKVVNLSIHLVRASCCMQRRNKKKLFNFINVEKFKELLLFRWENEIFGNFYLFFSLCMNFVAVECAAHNRNFPIIESVGNRYITKILKQCFLFVQNELSKNLGLLLFFLLNVQSTSVSEVVGC